MFHEIYKFELKCPILHFLPSLNLISLGAHFSLNFSMRAGPKGAAPPVTATTLDKCDDFTAGCVAKKLTKGGTMFNQVGWKNITVQLLIML